MYTKCREHGMRVRKEDVRLVLKVYVDLYYKVKPHVNGCIDGFSRRMIWLNAYTTRSDTSNDPKMIGGYYIEEVQHLGGCPRVVRGDLGTENGHI